MTNLLSSCLDECCFEVQPPQEGDATFQGLQAACYVDGVVHAQLKLYGEVTLTGSARPSSTLPALTLKTKMFSACVKNGNMPHGLPLLLQKQPGADEIDLSSVGDGVGERDVRFQLPLIADDTRDHMVPNIEWSHTIQMQLFHLKRLLGIAETFKGDHIRFQLWQGPEHGSQRIMVLRLEIKGEASMTESFVSATEDNGDGHVIVVLDGEPCPREAECELLINDIYAVKMLSKVTKAMENQVLLLRMSQKQHALQLHYRLGDLVEDSSILFTIAAAIDN